MVVVNPPYIRPSVIIIEHDKVLCIRIKYAGGEHWVFPGGGLESGETLREAAAREVREEAGFDVEVGKLVYVQDLLRDRQTNNRAIDLFFLGKRKGAQTYATTTDGGKNIATQWIPLAEFAKTDFLPAAVRENLRNDYLSGFKEFRYLEEVLKK